MTHEHLLDGAVQNRLIADYTVLPSTVFELAS